MVHTHTHSCLKSTPRKRRKRALPRKDSPHRWCRWCGEDIPQNHPLFHCGLSCIVDDIEAAKRNHEAQRLNGLYVYRAQAMQLEAKAGHKVGGRNYVRKVPA